jgi:predicted ribosomally synthesized peptide with nif11-like leader
MSIESARAFYQRITTDQAFRSQLQNTPSEQRTSVIEAAGYNFTSEEWETATADILETAILETAKKTDAELQEKELEAIAGGFVAIPLYGLPPHLRWPWPLL